MRRNPVPTRDSASAAKAKAPRYPIESVANSAQLLGLFLHTRELRLSNVARSLEISPSTAHRLLTTLEAQGLVQQNPITRCYEPGSGLLEIARALVPADSRWSFARPYMAELSERVGQTVNLLTLQGTRVVFVESVETTSSVRVGSRLGALMSAHCTSGGKLLLSLLPEEKLFELYPTQHLEQSSDNSIATRDKLLAELRKVAKRGYATNFGESEPGISGVAVLVPSTSADALALAVSVPEARLTTQRVTEFVDQLVVTAEALAAHQR
jgi:IclR family transcriptional regulator, acetate operon repressor